MTHELCLVYDAEHQLLEAQQQMHEMASDGELKGTLQTYVDQ